MATLSATITRSSSISSVNLTSLGGDDYLVGRGDNLLYNYKSGGTIIGTPSSNWSFQDANKTPTGYSVSGTDGDPTSSFTYTTLYGGFTDSGQTWSVVISGVSANTRTLKLFWHNEFADADVTAELSDNSVSPLTINRDSGSGSGDFFMYDLEFAAASSGQSLTLTVTTYGPNCFIGWLWVSSEAGGVEHTTTGALVGQGSTLSGTANNFTVHTTTGSLTGQGSSIVGSANNFTVHATSGALSGQGSLIEGAARNFTVHPSSGALVGQGSIIDGVAEHSVAGVHDATGDLVGQGSILDGDADHISVNPPTPTPIPGGGGGITYVTTKIKPKKRIREMLEAAYTQVEPVVSTNQEKTLKKAVIKEVIKEINQDFTNDNSFDIQSLITLIQIERQKYLRRMKNRKAAIMLLLE